MVSRERRRGVSAVHTWNKDLVLRDLVMSDNAQGYSSKQPGLWGRAGNQLKHKRALPGARMSGANTSRRDLNADGSPA
jgi:hypothetical protein